MFLEANDKVNNLFVSSYNINKLLKNCFYVIFKHALNYIVVEVFL